MASSSQHRCVFVGNIPYDATEKQLVQICEEVGPVVSFRLVLDRETGKPKGYGFCEYKDEETALSARRNLQGYEINGRQLRVDFAENDKGSDRNREQGRGGPGIATNVDAQKQVGGPAVIGDPSLHQPVGLPIAVTAASVMAGALGVAQSTLINQSSFQNQLPVGSDPLTLHLAKMSRSELNQVIHEMKVLSTQNKDLARQLLLVFPQLPKALFQAQIMLGMVTPQMLQLANLRQQAPLPMGQPSVQPAGRGQQPAVQMLQGLSSFAPLTSVSHSSLAQNQFSAAFPVPPQHLVQLPGPSQIAAPPQIAVPSKSRPLSIPSVHPLPPIGPQIPVVSSQSFRPVQASLLQHPVHGGQLDMPNGHFQPSFQSHHMSSDPMYQAVSSVRPVMVEATMRDTAKHAQNIVDAALVARTQAMTNLAPSSDNRDSQDQLFHPSKRMKSDERRDVPFSSAGLTAPIGTHSELVKLNVSSSIITGQSSAAESQGLEKQAPQLPPDVDMTLLQQVLNLSPEQLSSLPPEQQQQVLQLQQMYR